MQRTNTWFLAVVALLTLGAGCSFTQTVNRNADFVTSNQNVSATEAVKYAGQEGKNALELLQASHQVDVTDQGFVNAIDGVKPGERKFWAFYVNNEQAQIGARDYITKDGDQIEWRLEGF